MSGDVRAMYPHLVARVTSCWHCPFAFLKSMAPWGGDQDWGCNGEQLRSIGSERPKDGSPEWCPLKRQPVLVRWAGDRENGDGQANP